METKQRSAPQQHRPPLPQAEEGDQALSWTRHRPGQEETVARQISEYQTTLGHLASTLAHDLCNPFNTIFLHADLLEEDLQQLAPQTRAHMLSSIAEIKTEVARLHAIVQDYLTLARLEDFTYQPETLETVVEACSFEMLEVFETRSLTLHCEGLADLGHVALHRTSLRRALSNLLQQAAGTMAAGGTLTVRGRQEGTWACIEVCGAGQGIPAEELLLVFTPWYTTHAEGTGLELYVAQAIAVAHGGRVTVQSSRGQGITFTMTLPCIEGVSR